MSFIQLIGEPASAPAGSAGSYPPNDISESLKSLPDWIKRGCGNDEYYCEEKGATFLGGNMPEALPDLTNHNSFFSEVMKANPALYAQLKDKKTSLGVTLGHCIKTGIDNPGTAQYIILGPLDDFG